MLLIVSLKTYIRYALIHKQGFRIIESNTYLYFLLTLSTYICAHVYVDSVYVRAKIAPLGPPGASGRRRPRGVGALRAMAAPAEPAEPRVDVWATCSTGLEEIAAGEVIIIILLLLLIIIIIIITMIMIITIINDYNDNDDYTDDNDKHSIANDSHANNEARERLAPASGVELAEGHNIM